MSQGEFRPESRPLFVQSQTGDPVPDVDFGTGLQRVVWLGTRHQLCWPSGPGNSSITKQGWFSLSRGWAGGVAGHMWVFGRDQALLHQEDFTLISDKRRWWGLPENTEIVSVAFNAGRSESVAWCWEKLGK